MPPRSDSLGGTTPMAYLDTGQTWNMCTMSLCSVLCFFKHCLIQTALVTWIQNATKASVRWFEPDVVDA